MIGDHELEKLPLELTAEDAAAFFDLRVPNDPETMPALDGLTDAEIEAIARDLEGQIAGIQAQVADLRAFVAARQAERDRSS